MQVSECFTGATYIYTTPCIYVELAPDIPAAPEHGCRGAVGLREQWIKAVEFHDVGEFQPVVFELPKVFF